MSDSHIDYIEFPASSVEELNTVRDFFSSVFGWTYAMYGDDYADTGDSGTASGVNAEDPTRAIMPLIRVLDLDATYEQVKASGGTITKEPYDFPGGRRFYFTTPAGHELGAWTPVEPA